MAQLLIRQLEKPVLAALRARAQDQGPSLEQSLGGGCLRGPRLVSRRAGVCTGGPAAE
jgi:hypothetical protein